MNQETTKTKTKKHSQVKNALLSCAVDLFIIIILVGGFVERIYRANHFDIQDYNPTNVTIRNLFRLLIILFLIFMSIYRLKFINSTEKTDELSDLHRYKAGYIAKYISLLVIIIGICTIKNFEPIFTDFFDNISLAIVILLFGELITNTTFII
ncbi:MAG: hypothetical protein IKK33_11830 [Lachnospiraceae bacterium]|nr:hypothetical protein [Lachnospiraceae bacterium]